MGTLTTKLRPIKLGLLIKRRDWKGLLDAIETASSFWGGMFFPIIVSQQRISGPMRREMPRRVSAAQMLSGYIDAFDPDIIVPFNGAPVSASAAGRREIIDSSLLFERFADDDTPCFGIGAPEVISHFIQNELKYVRRQPLRILFPKLAAPYRAFLASVFGQLPREIETIVKDLFPPELQLESPECSIDNFADLFGVQDLFLRRLMIQHLNIRCPEACLYFLNAGSEEDIIGFWNLRAVGWSVLPVPEQACENESIKQLATSFINENYWAHPENPDFFHHTNLIKGRNASPRALVKFINSLTLEPPKAQHSPRITILPTYPRIWDEWAREKDSAEVQRLYSSESEASLPDDAKEIEFVPVAPRFLRRFGGHGSPRFANDIEIRFYGESDPVAEVIPSGDRRLIRAIGGYSFERWRFSRNGMSYLCEHPGMTVRLTPPRAERVFSEWLRCDGWQVELSDKGHIAAQMIKRLGGTWGIGILSSPGLIALLKKMTAARLTVQPTIVGLDPAASTEPAGKIVKAKTFIGEVAKICSTEGERQPDDYLRRLLELQMFRLGVEVQCPTCRQRWWESLKQLDYNLICPNCFETFSVASWLPKDFDWAFRTVGPFSLPDSAFGVYPVLLTLRFFSRLLRGASTPLVSFKLRKGDPEIEVDLGLLFSLRQHGKDQRDVIFAECKSYNEFTRKDVRRLKYIADSFPRAVLVLALLRDSLSRSEQKLLRPFVTRCRRYGRGERPIHPVVILTANELFASSAPPRSWEKLAGAYERFKSRYELGYNLADLADATQQIYLDLPPWHQWLASKRPAPPPPPAPVRNDEPVDESLVIKVPISVALRRVEFGEWR